jgi:hypothetical protein
MSAGKPKRERRSTASAVSLTMSLSKFSALLKDPRFF